MSSNNFLLVYCSEMRLDCFSVLTLKYKMWLLYIGVVYCSMRILYVCKSILHSWMHLDRNLRTLQQSNPTCCEVHCRRHAAVVWKSFTFKPAWVKWPLLFPNPCCSSVQAVPWLPLIQGTIVCRYFSLHLYAKCMRFKCYRFAPIINSIITIDK